MTGSGIATRTDPRARKGPGRIPAWKFTAGVMIHLYPVAYAVALTIKVIGDGGILLTRQAIREDLTIAPLVLLAWTVLTVAATIVAGVASATMRRRQEWLDAHDPSAPARLSNSTLIHALEDLTASRALLDDAGNAALDRIVSVTSGPWNSEDIRVQRISRDLGSAAQMLHASTATGGADASRVMGEALATLATAAEDAARDRSRDGVEGAHVFLDYLAASYGPPSTDPLRIP